MTQHTPAPWKAILDTSIDHGAIINDANIEIAKVDCRYGMIGEPEANTRLIAAAPELLEALKLSTKILEETIGNLPNPGYGWLEGKVDARIIRNHALIAKAKGES